MALVDRELDRYQVDMAALSETRLADVGEAAEAHYTFFWSGKASNLKREAGVGFAIKTSLVPKLLGKPKTPPHQEPLRHTHKCLCPNHAVS